MRTLHPDFITAMHEKLLVGFKKGYKGWQSHWEESSREGGIDLPFLMGRLDEEVEELVEVVNQLRVVGGHQNEVRHEAADVANIAMMIADMAGVLKDD